MLLPERSESFSQFLGYHRIHTVKLCDSKPRLDTVCLRCYIVAYGCPGMKFFIKLLTGLVLSIIALPVVLFLASAYLAITDNLDVSQGAKTALHFNLWFMAVMAVQIPVWTSRSAIVFRVVAIILSFVAAVTIKFMISLGLVHLIGGGFLSRSLLSVPALVFDIPAYIVMILISKKIVSSRMASPDNFVSRSTEGTKNILVFRLCAIYYWLLWPTVIATCLPWPLNSPGWLFLALTLWVILISVGAQFWSAKAEVKRITKSYSVKTFGSRYSFTNPPRYEWESTAS